MPDYKDFGLSYEDLFVFGGPGREAGQGSRKADPANYEAVCAELGMDASIGFVQITPIGSISFSIGKPEECRLLVKRARECGYAVSRELSRAATR